MSIFAPNSRMGRKAGDGGSNAACPRVPARARMRATRGPDANPNPDSARPRCVQARAPLCRTRIGRGQAGPPGKALPTLRRIPPVGRERPSVASDQGKLGSIRDERPRNRHLPSGRTPHAARTTPTRPHAARESKHEPSSRPTLPNVHPLREPDAAPTHFQRGSGTLPTRFQRGSNAVQTHIIPVQNTFFKVFQYRCSRVSLPPWSSFSHTSQLWNASDCSPRDAIAGSPARARTRMSQAHHRQRSCGTFAAPAADPCRPPSTCSRRAPRPVAAASAPVGTCTRPRCRESPSGERARGRSPPCPELCFV